MKEQLFTEEELTAMGFVFNYRFPLEEGGHYEVYDLEKNDSAISITYEFNPNGTFNTGYVEMNGTVLKGRNIETKDVELLKELM